MDRPEFLYMKSYNSPGDVTDQHDLKDEVDDKGCVILWVDKGMYGLPYADIIAQKILKERLESHN